MATAKQRAWRAKFARLYGHKRRHNPRRKKRSGGGFGDGHARRPRVHVGGGLMTLAPGSPWKKKIRRVNPILAQYLNPRRRRRKGGHMARRHRRHHRNPPEIAQILHHPGDVLIPPLIAGVSAYSVVTGGNYLMVNFLSTYLPTALPGTVTDVLTKAGVRAAVAWGGDYLVKRSAPHYLGAYRIGAGLGIVASAVMEFLGKTFILGLGDEAQMPGSALAGVAGAGAYLRQPLRGLAGGRAALGDAVDGTGAYMDSQVRLRGVGGLRLGSMQGNRSFNQLYGTGGPWGG